jgi:RimJ/RimL family protein N-acetyltransferase
VTGVHAPSATSLAGFEDVLLSERERLFIEQGGPRRKATLDFDYAFMGGAGLNQMNPMHAFCNLGYWVRGSAQRQGAATAVTAALARYAFEQLQQSRVEIVIADGNLASLAVARKAGAVHECLARNRLQLHGGPIDAHVFSLIPS